MSAYKDKKNKLRFDLIPPEMDLAFAEVATFGIEKLKGHGVENPDRNWESGLMLVSDHLAALKRHINKWERGVDNDEESGLNHLKHALWHMAAMVTHVERGRIELDDRPSDPVTKALNEWEDEELSTRSRNDSKPNDTPFGLNMDDYFPERPWWLYKPKLAPEKF